MNSDLVLSLNTPLQVHEQSSSAILIETRESLQEKKTNTSLLFKSILETAFVKDWSLFG